MQYKCAKCKTKCDANDAWLLHSLPYHISEVYPVDPKFAHLTMETGYSTKQQHHIHRSTTDMYDDEGFLTYGNGDLFSRQLFSAINRSYVKKVQNYGSYINWAKDNGWVAKEKVPASYPSYEGDYLTWYPPMGKELRNLFLSASKSLFTPYQYAEHTRYLREIESVGRLPSDKVISVIVDHTMSIMENYQKRDRKDATCAFTVGIQDGQIACVAMAKTTALKDVSHAVEQLARREFSVQRYFTPTLGHTKTSFGGSFLAVPWRVDWDCSTTCNDSLEH